MSIALIWRTKKRCRLWAISATTLMLTDFFRGGGHRRLDSSGRRGHSRPMATSHLINTSAGESPSRPGRQSPRRVPAGRHDAPARAGRCAARRTAVSLATGVSPVGEGGHPASWTLSGALDAGRASPSPSRPRGPRGGHDQRLSRRADGQGEARLPRRRPGHGAGDRQTSALCHGHARRPWAPCGLSHPAPHRPPRRPSPAPHRRRHPALGRPRASARDDPEPLSAPRPPSARRGTRQRCETTSTGWRTRRQLSHVGSIAFLLLFP
jgi:hypothetical protein